MKKMTRPPSRDRTRLYICSGHLTEGFFSVRVLGIDPGTRFTGFGVVEQRQGRLVHVGHGVIRADECAPLEIRLMEIFSSLSAALATHSPDAVAVEGLFAQRHPRSALVLGHARGVALLVAGLGGLPVFEYPPAKVKRSVGASGAADKDAVARMVMGFLKIEIVERQDASDALAVAICHLNHSRVSAVSPTGSRPKSRGRGAFKSLADRLSPAVVKGSAP